MIVSFSKATPQDALLIAPFILYAMDKILYDFLGEQNEQKALTFIEKLIRSKRNQYSYENITLVKSDKNETIGIVNIYNGADLLQLRTPVLELLQKEYHRTILPQDETQTGEFYIDTIAVSPEYRGKGIGQKILDYIIQKYVQTQKQTVGLLVDLNHPNAKKLYLNKRFRIVGKKQLMNQMHEHLQLSFKDVN